VRVPSKDDLQCHVRDVQGLKNGLIGKKGVVLLYHNNLQCHVRDVQERLNSSLHCKRKHSQALLSEGRSSCNALHVEIIHGA